MTEYALLKSGRIVDVVMTGRSLSETAERYPEYEVMLLSLVHSSVQQAYQLWGERP